MIIEIIVSLANKLGIIIILAILISKIGIFRKLVTKKNITIIDKIILAVVFGAIGILGTYSSVPVNGAIANTRVVGVMVGGLLGGPVVGVMAGMIAGGHRYVIDIGGFTALACAVATIIEGFIGGYAHFYIKNKSQKWKYTLFIGIFAEIVQMAIILLIARPFGDAFTLVKIILLPMVLVNSIGISLFIGIIENIHQEYERIAAGQAEKTLKIANQTLPYFRQGLNEEVAKEVVNIIYHTVDVAAVTITNCKEILAHKGAEEDHHVPMCKLQTQSTRDVVISGEHRVIFHQRDIQCDQPKCQLKSVIIVPLKEREEVVGTLKLYKREENSITTLDVELALGLAQLFSTQIELSRLDYQKKLLAEAELKTLQAQINPHFLFNTINTIVSFVQVDPTQAKQLLISLADLFRKSLSNNQDMVDMETEIEHVASYLEIEKARFGDQLKVKYELQENITCKLPPLILQPLVENAVIHGILPKRGGGEIKILSKKLENCVLLEIVDNGLGISQERLLTILKPVIDSKSVGLMNVNKRLINLYGEAYCLEVSSEVDHGTKIQVKIPC
ncbi:signal transduction histidine kinase, LytS [Alkaliphilus metalliredigens QYMF]|uniref:histidine kinase n=1 Tax=Alkaliphilus metalliredigens (strain QYMF) TaxID=293826 RepID=A6TN09_ALKMQ|nr:LytS/YhcK type 5TM receptor domain-containing protein [Alkaliphilus metalliredigens]ABR47577.1 signal transduction histidine kinase, LytS [Alkaliphilus metalliredigens QYMF]